MVDVCRYYQVFIKFVLGHLQTRRHILFILSCVSHDVEISCVFFLFSFAPFGVIIFLLKKTTLCQLVEWYVARTNQIAALGYVSRTNYITAFGSCTNHSVWVLYSCKLCHGFRGPCTENDLN